MRRLVATMAAALAVVAWASPAVAAPKAPAVVSYSITLDQAAPARYDVVTFTTTGTDSLRLPYIVIECYQGSTWVWGRNLWPSESVAIGGGTSPWVSGDAVCRADLAANGKRGERVVYASTSFTVTG